MGRKATILDVLREARGSEQEPSARTPDEAPAVRRPEPKKNARKRRPRGERSGAGVAGWFTATASVTRAGLLVAGVLFVASVWVAFTLGVTKGRNVARAAAGGGSNVAGPRLPEGPDDRDGRLPGKPAPMRDVAPVDNGAKRGANPGNGGPGTKESKGGTGGAASTATKRTPYGLRIVTYADNPESRELALAMRAHLARHLAGTDARDDWFLEGGKLVVAVVFPRDRRDDAGYRARLLERLQRIPPPDPAKARFDFSKLTESLIMGRPR